MRNKERKGKRQDPRQSEERESSKVRVLGFKNAYRLERVSRIKYMNVVGPFLFDPSTICFKGL